MAYLLLAFYCYFLNINGPFTPFLKDELKLSYPVSSLHFTAFAIGILLVGLSGHILIQHIGRWHALWLGAFGINVSTFILLAGKSVAFTIGASFCLGLVGSLILVIIPSVLSDQHGDMRAVALSEANVIASLVSTAAPLVVGWSANIPGGWRLALGTVDFAPFLMRIGFGRPPLPLSTSRPIVSPSLRGPSPIMFWVYWAALVLAVFVEFCRIYWSADYLENSLGILKADAAQANSLFLTGMIIGRLAGSHIIQFFQRAKWLLPLSW